MALVIGTLFWHSKITLQGALLPLSIVGAYKSQEYDLQCQNLDALFRCCRLA